MKKKILMILIALFMFIPLTIVKADELDDVIANLNERIGGHEILSGIFPGYGWYGNEIAVEKVDTNKIKVTATTDISGAYASWPEGFIDDSDTTATSFIIYEYQNSTLSFKGEFGFYGNNEEIINYKTAEKDSWADMLANQNNKITRELLHATYEVKTGKDDSIITAYLEEKGLEKIGGSLSFAPYNADGIKITVDEDGWVTEYSINLSQINIPESTNNNETNTDNNNNNQTTTDNLAGHGYATDDNNFSISFVDVFGKQYEFTVKSLSDVRKAYASKEDTEPSLETIDRKISNLKEELKDNGTYIDLYNIVVSYGNEEKKDGPFTFRIKYTEEMKKFNTLELVNIENGKKTNDIVKMKVDGDYIVGELPHLSEYALVGRKTDNPGTGVTKYTVPGVALLLTTFGIYALYKKKSEI